MDAPGRCAAGNHPALHAEDGDTKLALLDDTVGTLATFDRRGPSTGLREDDWVVIEPEETP